MSKAKDWQNQLKLYRLMKNVGVYEVVIDDNFSLLYGNDRYYEIHGYTKEEMNNLMQNQCINYIYAEDLSAVRQIFQPGLLYQGSQFEWVMRVIARDKTIKYVHVIGTLEERNGQRILVGTVTDITEQKILEQQLLQANREIQKQKEQIDNIINSIPGGVAIYKVSDIFETVYFSDGVAELSGYTTEEYRALMQDDAAKMTHPEDTAMVVSRLRQALDMNISADFSFRKIHRNGNTVWVHLQGKKIG